MPRAAECRGDYVKTEPIKFTTGELSLLYYLEMIPHHVGTPSLASTNGFTMEQIRSLLNDRKQKYCAAIHSKDVIYLFHSVYMVDDKIFACTAQSGISDTYVRFHVSKFTQLVSGLVNFSIFPAEADSRNLCILTVPDLLGTKDVTSLAEHPRIFDVPLGEVVKTTRPLPTILLTGSVFHGLVTSVFARNNEYGYCCGPIDELKCIQSVASDGDHRYNPFIYFLTAVYQDLNPGMTNLPERE